MKRQFTKNFIERFREVLIEIEQSSSTHIDDIIVGMTSLYVFKSSDLHKDDMRLMWWIENYQNLDNFIISANKLVNHGWIDVDKWVKFVSVFKALLQNFKIGSRTLEIWGVVLSDILKSLYEYEASDESITEILNFMIDIIKNEESNYKAISNLWDGLITYLRFLHPGHLDSIKLDEENTLCLKLLEIILYKSRFPAFFDTQDYSAERFSCKSVSFPDEEYEEAPEECADDNQLKAAFVTMRETLSVMILEIWLRTKNLTEIIVLILEQGIKVIKNDHDSTIDQANIDLEAILNTIWYFIQGAKNIHKLSDSDRLKENLNQFFISEEGKEIFTNYDLHHQILQKYIFWILQLEEFFQDEQFSQETCGEILKIFFRDNILMSKSASTLNYYSNWFYSFMGQFVKYISEEDLVHILTKILQDIIPVMIGADEKYMKKAKIFFEILGIIAFKKSFSAEFRTQACKNWLDFINEMFDQVTTFSELKLCQSYTLAFLRRMSFSEDQDDISEQVYGLQMNLVNKLYPDLTLENSMDYKQWNIAKANNADGLQCMIQLRKIIIDLYWTSNKKVSDKIIDSMLKISLPVIVSFIYGPDQNDSITGEMPTTEDIQFLLQTILNALYTYNENMLTITKLILPSLLKLVVGHFSQIKDKGMDYRSDAYFQSTNIVEYLLRAVQRVAAMNSHVLIFNNNDEPNFFPDLLQFCYKVITGVSTVKCSEEALNCLLFLLKDYSPYEDEILMNERSKYHRVESSSI